MTHQVIINTHEATDDTASAVDRRHYSVAALIAELQKCDPQAEVVIKNLNTGKFGCLNYQGVEQVQA